MRSVWGLESGELQASFTGHTGPVNSVAVTPDGKRIVSTGGTVPDGSDNSIRCAVLRSCVGRSC